MRNDFMRQLVFPIVVALILWSLLGCQPTGNASNRPEGFTLTTNTNVDPFVLTHGSDPNGLCLRIHEVAFWETGNQADALGNQVRSSLEVTLDNENLSGSDLIIASWDNLYYAYDQNNNIVGSFGGGLGACFSVAHLENGLHTISAQASSLSNRVHSAILKFEVRQGEPILLLTPVATTMP